MFRKKTGILIVTLSVTLLGLLWLQYYWVNFSFHKKSEEFDTRINRALAEVSTEVEESFYCIDFFSEFSISPGEGLYVLKHDWISDGYLTTGQGYSADTIPIYFWNKFSSDSLILYSNIKFRYPANIRMELNVEYLMEKNPDFLKNDATINSYRESIAENENFQKTLDSVLTKHIQNEENQLIFYYQIKEMATGKILISKPDNIHAGIFDNKTGTVVFRDNYFFSPLKLSLFFPDKKKTLIKELWTVILISLVLIGLLVSLMLYFIRILIQQQRLSEMKSDFISNMTHEFKTPVANINLALETLEKQGLAKDENTQLYTGIIREENRRLRNNINLILETSLFENKTLKLSKLQIDVHDLITGIIETKQIEYDQKNGKIKSNFLAGQFIISADEVHLTNTFLNLLDNAIKYSEREPDITVTSVNKDNFIIISVEDKGKGIPAQSLDKIFEKFYRVPHGNKHDVKGFGLGLYYVKQVLEAHHGKIKVRSEINKGSRFEIWLPMR
ncbi:MAG: GHKL domain-containing protein [Bacteroidales bacterium]|nr:GHKL domain-containing protein [Bacteroidales bacterium]